MVFIEYPKCTTCQKAKKWLEKKHITFTDRNIVTDTPNKKELKEWIEKYQIPIDKFWNTSGLKYRELNLKEKKEMLTEEEKLQLLESDGMLLKRPIIITSTNILIGFNEKDWNILLTKE